mmetsp:Transcript_15840/g.36938  ORF Transcript_15840/g.36938 Transcript_15840/m.36938 type:complete len:201 (+) Transcript_15840:76-678(+)
MPSAKVHSDGGDADAALDEGADTHVVKFEGAQDQIIVVAKKMELMRWLLGSDGAMKACESFFERYNLTIVFLVMGIAATTMCPILYATGIEDKRWYWLVVGSGVWVWLNMLSTRNALLLKHLLSNFDALFNISNMLVASLCLGASFGFDERAAAFLLVPFPVLVATVLADATMSDNEFKLRRVALLYGVLLLVSGTCTAT